MATIIKLKRGTTTPTTGDITSGEVAIDTSAQKLYINDSGTIKEINGKDIDITGSATIAGDLTVDTNTLYVDATNNRVGIGTTSPAYQFEIENTGANALLVLDRTDGAGCFIEGQATRSAFGSVGATPLALAYNSAAVVTIGANGAITVNPDGANPFTFPTSDGSANQVLQTDGSGTLSFATVSSGSDITVQDEGSSLSTAATTLNFVGNGVTATGSGSTKTITITQATLSDLSVTATSTELNLLDGITAIADEDDMTSNSDTSLATQQSIKAYVDSQAVDLSSIGESLLPDVTETRDLGSTSKRWRDLYLSGNTINLNGATISSDGTGSITISATGAVLPENSKVSVASGVDKELALAGADGSPVQSVPFFSKAGGLNTQNTKLDFKADPDKVVAAFTLANGTQLGSSQGDTLFFF